MASTSSSGEAFVGRSAEMRRDTPWLAAEDLHGLGEVPVTIAGVFRHKDVEFAEGRKERVVYSVQFEHKQRQLVLNATNRKTLLRKFGPQVKDWLGKQVTLYVDENIRFGKQTVCGIRIK